MQYSVTLLGRSTVKHLQARATDAVLSIGSDHYSRTALAMEGMHCHIAARNLNDYIRKKLPNIKNTRDLFLHVEPEQFAFPGIGDYAFAVLEACFTIKELGTLDDWTLRSRQKGEKLTTFATMKTHISKTTTRTVRKSHTKKRRPSAQPSGASAEAVH